MTVEVSGPSGASVSVLGEGITEVAVTGAVTLDSTAFGKMHLCTGTSADYTIDLPAASGNSGKHIGFRMGVTLTKLVTLDPNAAELIDGQATRIMWSQEVAVLYCDGTGWRKVAGRSRPMDAVLRLGANQSLSNNTYTKITAAIADIDSSGAMVDTVNNKITCKRPGTYDLFGQVYVDSAAMTRGLAGLNKNGSPFFSAEESSYNASAYPVAQTELTAILAVADYLELYGLQTSGGAKNVLGDATTIYTFFKVLERVSW